MTSERLRALASAPDPRLAANTGVYFDPQGPDVTEVLLIRHGHIPVSAGNEDPDLTQTGHEQAAVLAAYLAERTSLTAIYSSPFRRAQATAAPIAASQGLSVVTMQELREIETYLPAGRSMREHLGEDAWQLYSKRMAVERRWDVRGDLGEPSAKVRARAVAAVEAAIAAHRGGRVALVSHGPVILSYFAAMFESSYDLLFLPRLTSISVVWARGDGRRAGMINGTPHFDAL
jgi:probable phosphoglycerate mutase